MADTVPDRNAPFSEQNFDDRVKLVEASFKTMLDMDQAILREGLGLPI
jgi:hypothetical protein